MVLVDGHVHMYECFSVAGVFDAAAANFDAASRELQARRALINKRMRERH